MIQRLALTDARPKYISIENGNPEMLEILTEMGYGGFKFINQAKVESMVCPLNAREGNSIPWRFPWSSSGPFGDDTPGVWKTSEEILVDTKPYWDNPDRDAGVVGWCDLHARFGDISTLVQDAFDETEALLLYTETLEKELEGFRNILNSRKKMAARIMSLSFKKRTPSDNL